MCDYTEFQEKIAIAYAQTKFADFLSSAATEEKTYGKDIDVFLKFVEVGLESAAIWNSQNK